MIWPLLIPATTVSLGAQRPRALSRAHCPPATLASLFSLPQASHAPVSGLCICISFGWSLAGTRLLLILSAGFLPSLIQKSLVLSNIPSKHTASRHSPSSHLTFFPSWHLLPDAVTYLFVDLFECPSPPQYTSSSSVSATTACPQPRQCSPQKTQGSNSFLKATTQQRRILPPSSRAFHYIMLLPR